MLNYILENGFLAKFTRPYTVNFTKGDMHMTKDDKLLLTAGFVATLGVGIMVIPKLQKKYSNKLYKSYNRRVLKDKYGITIDK